MARFVVISVEDNEVAEELVRDWRDGGLDPGIEVVGLFGKPTQFCNSNDGKHPARRALGFTHGRKFGWWVCAYCGKPKTLYGKNPQAVISQARNLLPEVEERNEG